MTKLHHRGTAPVDPEALRLVLQRFLDSCKQPTILEEGDLPLPIAAGDCVLEVRQGRLWIQAWNQERNLSRRILDLHSNKPGLLVCSIHRFGNQPGRLTLLDADRPTTAALTYAAGRKNFAEQLRLMLARALPGWEIQQLSAARDLQRSFSSVYPRAHLQKGHHHVAALGCARLDEESGLLTFAILWLHYLRSRIPDGDSISLVLFLPEGGGALTAQRLNNLTAFAVRPRIYLFNEHGSAGEVDSRDLGNVQTRVAQLGERNRSSPLNSIEGPELRLEAAVRRQLEIIDPTLIPDLLHPQVLTFLSGERTIIDLLAVDRQGRLSILELKASEDLHLPLQALDYWERIRWHASRAELDHLFPGVTLSSAPPRLQLIAPATRFHSANQTVLQYFSPGIPVERIGVNSQAAQRLTVVMRLFGADLPSSHRNH